MAEQAPAMMVCELRSRENREFERKSLQSGENKEFERERERQKLERWELFFYLKRREMKKIMKNKSTFLCTVGSINTN